MKKSVLIYGIAMSFLIACQSNAEHHDGHNTEVATEADNHDHAADEHAAHAANAAVVQLDNGQKWPANLETTEGIEKMSGMLAALPADAQSADYLALKTKLESEFATILQKCTMTGEAHNQLHNYLLPMKDLIGELESNAIEEQQEVVVQLNAYLNDYDLYFQ